LSNFSKLDIGAGHGFRFRQGATACALIASIFALACGSSSQDVLFIQAPTDVIKVGERISLTAQATETLASQPEWDVHELDGGYFMRTTGTQVTYLAPLYAGRYHVSVKAARANGQIAKATWMVIVQPELSIEPATARVQPGGTQSFAVKIKGIEPPKIVWAIDDARGGTISPSGLYTAPSKPGYYQITATAQTEGLPYATASVRVE
jgi:hypothetical protein